MRARPRRVFVTASKRRRSRVGRAGRRGDRRTVPVPGEDADTEAPRTRSCEGEPTRAPTVRTCCRSAAPVPREGARRRRTEAAGRGARGWQPRHSSRHRARGKRGVVWSAAKELRVKLATGRAPRSTASGTLTRSCRSEACWGFGVVAVAHRSREGCARRRPRHRGLPAARATVREPSGGGGNVADRPAPISTAIVQPLRACATARATCSAITGEARKRGKQPATQPLRDAVARFEGSARLIRAAPILYLGLARTYVYGLEDLDKAIAAMQAAEQRGYRPGTGNSSSSPKATATGGRCGRGDHGERARAGSGPAWRRQPPTTRRRSRSS